MALSYLILGSNSVDKNEILGRTITLINKLVGTVTATSSVYETEAWGYESQNSYLNQALSVDTTHSPIELLHITQEIERNLGRSSKSINGVYTDRPIDIDILFYADEIVNMPELIIPHQHIAARRFVLEPMNELAPDLQHPVQERTIHQLLENCSDKLAVKKL